MRLVGVRRKERNRSNEEPPEVRVSRSDPGILEGGLVPVRIKRTTEES